MEDHRDDEQDTFGNLNGESEQQNDADSGDAASNGHRSVPGTPMSARSLAGSVAGTPQTPRLPFSAMSPFTPSSAARSAVPGSRDSTALPRSDLGMTPLRRRTFSTSSSVQRSQSSTAAAAASNTPRSERSTPRKRARTGTGAGGGGGGGSDDGNNSDDAGAPRYPAGGSPPNSPSPPGSPAGNGGAQHSPPASPGANGHGAGGMDEAVIWGTDVNVNTAMENFRHFIRHFTEEEPEAVEQPLDSDDDDDAQQQQQQQRQQPHYMALLSEIARSSVYSIEINCRHLFNHPRSRELYGQLLRYPQEIVPIMDLVVHQEFCAAYGEDALQSARIQVR
jgi:DNA replication licensing factor MCM4